ncbi:hypothetical protein ABPG72_003440 [Tetrahymena utriculariae]
MSSNKQDKKGVKAKENSKTVKISQDNNEIYVINEEDREEHEAILQKIEETLGDTFDLKKKLNEKKDEKQQIQQQDEQINAKQPTNTQQQISAQSNMKSANFQQGKLVTHKENEEKYKKEISQLKSQIVKLNETVDKIKTESNKNLRLLNSTQAANKNFQTALDKSEDFVKQLQEKISQLTSRNRELEKQSVEVNRQSDQLYKDKKSMETQKDKLNLQITDLMSRCDILKNENKHLTEVMIQKNKQSNDKIDEHLQKIQELHSVIADLKQQMKEYESNYQREKSAKDELRVKLKMHEISVQENEELKKKLQKKEDKLEELEDLVDQLKAKLRKFDTSLTIKDEHGQIKEYRSEKYSDLLSEKQANQIKQLQNELTQLSQNMGDFRNNNYKIESEKEALRVENISLKEEIKRLERMRLKEQNEYESEVREKLRTLENQRLKINQLQDQVQDLDKTRISKLEIIRDSEFQKLETELSQSKNKIQQLENLNQQMQYRIDHLEQISNKKQLVIGDIHFQNETLKEEVAYLTNLKEKNQWAKISKNVPLKNKENEILIVQPQLQSQEKAIQEQLSSPRQSFVQQQSTAKHRYELPQDMHPNILSSPTHFEKDNYANFYRDTRQMMDSLNRYQSSSTVASQNQRSYY